MPEAAIAIVLALPVLWLVGRIAMDLRVIEWGTLWAHLPRLIGRTLLYDSLATLLAFAIALPVAIGLGRATPGRALVILAAMVASLLQPPVVFLYGWSQVLGQMGHEIQPQSAADVARCIWTLACWLWPIPAAVLGLALRSIDHDLLDAARLDGAQRRVRAAQLVGPAIGAAAITLAMALQQFTVFEQTNILVVATELRTVFSVGTLLGEPVVTNAAEFGAAQQARIAAAGLVGLPVVVLVGALAMVARWALAPRSVAMGLGEVRGRRTGIWQAALALLVTAVLPIAAMRLAMAHPADWRSAAGAIWPQLAGSLLISGIVAAICLLLGIAASVLRLRIVFWLSVACFLIGGQLLALGAIQMFNQPWLDVLYDTPASVILVHVAMFVWISLLAARVTWHDSWRDLRLASRSDGASGWQQVTCVLLPGSWQWHAAAAAVVMSLSLGEISAVMLLQPQRPQMLMPMLMTWVHMLRYDAMIEGTLLLATVIFAMAMLGFVLVRIVGAGSAKRIGLFLCVLMFAGCGDPEKPLAIWKEPDIRPLVYPRGIAYSRPADEFFTVDRMARVQRISSDGKFIGEWQMPEQANGRPVGISVGPDGNIYVPDTHYYRVMVFTPEGKLLRKWGKFGTGPGEFMYLTDVAFDAQGRVFVSEYGDSTDRVQVFTSEGKYLYRFGRFGQGDGEFARPQSMVIHGDLVYITDAGNHRIVVFKTDGTFVRSFGKAGDAPGEYRFPYGLDEDADGNLIVTEFGNNRVQKIARETGEPMAMWGRAGRSPGELAYPWASAVDRRGRVVTVDSGNNRLQVIRFR